MSGRECFILKNTLLLILLVLICLLAFAQLVSASVEECLAQGKVLCSDDRCNIGHPECNPEPPSKTYTVPVGERCTFRGTITNSGCAWQNPAALTITGPGCNQVIRFSNCEVKSFEFTCNAGSVTLAANDSSYFTLTKSCAPVPNCGNGIINPGEQCEPPVTSNNAYCEQSIQECMDNKLGVRDGLGSCSVTCDCFEDRFSYSCVKDECGAECSSGADCDDNNDQTADICSDDCVCTNPSMPFCGNGIVDYGEQCESNTHCPAAKICSSCMCVSQHYCGDDITDSGEQCDYGTLNGLTCVPPMNGTCRFCSTNCTFITLHGGSCGNGIVDYGEQCDESSNNGAECTPARCGENCAYCNDDCQVSIIPSSDDCSGGGEIPYNPYDGYNFPVFYYGGFYYNRPRASVCGDGITGLGEDCDSGNKNGVVCSPDCSRSCSYCSSSCKLITLQGSPCVRRARPWDVHEPFCREVIVPVMLSSLDSSCGANNALVTARVNVSDDVYAEHTACTLAGSNIYLNWFDLSSFVGFSNISAVLEHKESYATLKLDYFNGANWVKTCDIYSGVRDRIDECLLPGINDYKNISLKLRIIRNGANKPSEMLDFAALKLVYCNDVAVACGNGRVELNEECDDGNTANGDGCSSICTIEKWSCGKWSECINGMQTQACSYGAESKINTKSCSSLNLWWLVLLIIIILLLLLFLFLPYFFVAPREKKDKNKAKK